MSDEGICESNNGSICFTKYTVSDTELQQGGIFATHPSTPKACDEDAGSYPGNQHVHVFTPIESRCENSAFLVYAI